MTVEYLPGPGAMRLSRKCRKERNRNYHSGVKHDTDVEEGKARTRALSLVEEITYETSDIEQGNRCRYARMQDARLHPFMQGGCCGKVVEAAPAITMDVLARRRKWMIDSGCAMDLVSKREFSPEELDLAGRVRKIKFNTATGSTRLRQRSILTLTLSQNALW